VPGRGEPDGRGQAAETAPDDHRLHPVTITAVRVRRRPSFD
jgi:hypothetical protein